MFSISLLRALAGGAGNDYLTWAMGCCDLGELVGGICFSSSVGGCSLIPRGFDFLTAFLGLGAFSCWCIVVEEIEGIEV